MFLQPCVPVSWCPIVPIVPVTWGGGTNKTHKQGGTDKTYEQTGGMEKCILEEGDIKTLGVGVAKTHNVGEQKNAKGGRAEKHTNHAIEGCDYLMYLQSGIKFYSSR